MWPCASHLISLTTVGRWVFSQNRPPSICYRTLRCAVSYLLLVLVVPLYLAARNLPGGVTVDDIETITEVRSWSVSPDGNHVAFLTVKAVPHEGQYELTLYLQTIQDPGYLQILTRYWLASDETVRDDSPTLKTTASQYVWSPDSTRLLYTAHHKTGMELRVWNVAAKHGITILDGHVLIEIDGPAAKQPGMWKIKSLDRAEDDLPQNVPMDRALLIKDGYSFDNPLLNPRGQPPTRVESWEYSWEMTRVRPGPDRPVVEYLGRPAEVLPNGDVITTEGYLYVSKYNLPKTDETEVQESSSPELVIDDSDPTKTVLQVKKGRTIRRILEEAAEFRPTNNAENPDESRQPYMSEDRRLAVLWRSTNLAPEELVKVDLATGKVDVLFAPNEAFRKKTNGVNVRFMWIEAGGGHCSHDRHCYGRLYLPADYSHDKRYPLVFTTYVASAGFDIGSGGEVPILALVTHGVAVFSLDVHPVEGEHGDFATTHKRWEQPLEALEWVASKLAAEGIIDPGRIGLSGLSFGAEITMYTYWKSQTFRAMSASSDIGWTPMMYFNAGPMGSRILDDLGFPEPNDGAYAIWKTTDAGLNARASLPPLLWQTADSERNLSVETWTRLRRAGAQVEWLEYPDEGHVKRGPANKWWVNQRNLDWFLFWLEDEEDPDPARAAQYERWREMRKKWETAKSAARVTVAPVN